MNYIPETAFGCADLARAVVKSLILFSYGYKNR